MKRLDRALVIAIAVVTVILFVSIAEAANGYGPWAVAFWAVLDLALAGLWFGRRLGRG